MVSRQTPTRSSATSLRLACEATAPSSRCARASIRKVFTSSCISSVALVIRSTCERARGSMFGLTSNSSQELASTIKGVRSSWLTSLVNRRSRVKASRKRPRVSSKAMAS
ncbi:hypothetical protein D9M71_537330 [compost metagenome]